MHGAPVDPFVKLPAYLFPVNGAAAVHGLDREALGRFLKRKHPRVWHSLEWDSAICLGVGLPALEH